MAALDPIRAAGLQDLQDSLRDMGGEMQDVADLVAFEAAELLVDAAKRRTPTLRGRARGSIRATDGAVKTGVPYFGWLDYGGNIYRHGRGKKPIHRTYKRGGRIIYPALKEITPEIEALMSEAFRVAAEGGGLEVFGG